MRTSTVLCVLVAIVVSAALVADGAYPRMWTLQDPVALVLTPLQLSWCRDRSLPDSRIIAACSDAISALRASNPRGDSVDELRGALVLRGKAYEHNGNLDDAIADFDDALLLDPANGSVFFLRGNALYSKRDYIHAIDDFSIAVRLDRMSADAFNNRGNAYEQIGDHDHAIADYGEAIRLHYTQSDPFARERLVGTSIPWDNPFNTFNQTNDLSGLAKTIRRGPSYGYIYRNRGASYVAKADYESAIRDYDEAIQRDPQSAIAFNDRGNVHRQMQDYVRAIADYTRAIELDPNAADAFKNRGDAYFATLDIDHAIADYGAAIRLDPNDAMAREDRARAYEAKGDQVREEQDMSAASFIRCGSPLNIYLDRGGCGEAK